MVKTWSVEEAAQLLGISRRLAYKLIERDEFPVPVLRIATTYRISKAQLAQYIDGDLAAAE